MSFVRLDPRDVVVSSDTVSAPVWSINSPTLTQFESSSAQQLQSTAEYYFEVYATASNIGDPQFSIAYADAQGLGSAPFNSSITGVSPSRVIYNQAKNLLLGDEELSFDFGGVSSDYFYVISMDRARYKERLMPASFNLNLYHVDKAGNQNALSLTDNSKDQATTIFKEGGRVYEIVEGTDGSATTGTGYTTASGSYGWMFPDVGMILLNGQALDAAGISAGGGGLGLDTSRGTTAGSNNEKLFTAIKSGASFNLSSEETITSNYIFCRARSDEFNYSTNPSMISGSAGDIAHEELINSPRTYATTVGIYNDNNDLLAVAKLSKPLQKDFTKEALVRLKLDF